MTERNDIGKLFRDNFNNFEVEPPDSVWQQIETNLPANIPVVKPPLNFTKRMVFGSASVVLVALIAGLIYLYSSNDSKPIQKVTEHEQTAQTIDNKVSTPVSGGMTADVESKNPQSNTLPSPRIDRSTQDSPKETPQQVIDSKAITTQEVLVSTEPKAAVVVAETTFKPLLTKPLPVIPDNLIASTLADTIAKDDTKELETKIITICKGEEVLLNAGDGSRYNWEHGAITQSVVVTPDEDVSYAVEYVGANGNKFKQQFDIRILDCSVYVPKAFSPNDDGSNDMYKLRTDGIHQFEIKIFSKWGELVFECKNPEIGWDGRIKGAKAPVGVYIYQVSFRDIKDNSRAIFGTLTLLP